MPIDDSVYIVIIGTEVLTAKVRDENGPFILGSLREAAVRVAGLSVVPDERAPLVDELDRRRRAHTHVITTGGVGPTHDDITFAAIAEVLSVPLIFDERLAARFRAKFPPGMDDGWRRMAMLPAGSELLDTPLFPQARCANLWVLPGVPALVRARLPSILPHLGARPTTCVAIRTQQGEPELAGLLEGVEHDIPGLRIGSYPLWGEADARVRITLEAEDRVAVEAGLARILGGLDPLRVVDVDHDYAPHRLWLAR